MHKIISFENLRAPVQGAARKNPRLMKKSRFLTVFLATLVAFTRLQAIDTINTGKQPEAGLVQGDDIPASGDIPAMQAFYGTTSGGGSAGKGTLFQVTDSGQLTTLVNFAGTADPAKGEAPVAALIRGSDGNFYGTTYGGGIPNLGTVFKVSGGLIAASFDFSPSGASDPEASLIKARDGLFYGTTAQGGLSFLGTVYSFNASTGVQRC